jgi:formylglycine-generating enzyme required for sulfatase activity/dienelactone hydrolase
MLGTTLSHYRIVERLGAGGMGVVYRAYDERLHRTVALKVLSPDDVADAESRRRLLKEARASSALAHANIVTIYDIDEADGLQFLVLELVQGQPLDRLITERGLPVERVLDYAWQMASALEVAHSAGIVHRDIKPANVMVSASGQVKILDFGIAKRLPSVVDSSATTVAATRTTEEGVVLGTVGYMAPEQARGQTVDARADIFSLGTVLYEMLAGRPAFRRDTPVATLTAILSDSPAPLSTTRRDVPPALGSLVIACLEKDPARRPPAAEIVRRLATLRAEVGRHSFNVRRVLRRPAVAAALGTVAVAAIGIGIWWWRASAREQWARETAPMEVQRLFEARDVAGAYWVAREALTAAPDDSVVRQLWSDVTMPMSFDSTPPGAEVSVNGYSTESDRWIVLGRTPLEDVRVPFELMRVRISRDGFAPVEGTLTALQSTYMLQPEGTVPPGMVFVPPATGRALGVTQALSEFWIDRYEVSNRDFKVFVDRGGYRDPQYWTEPIVANGRVLVGADAMSLFRDRTGRPGPATWELSSYPEGQADVPVSGVSWYEAAAYAAFVGKKLPTAFHWNAAAAFASISGLFDDILKSSNFDLKGPAPGGIYRGLGVFGTYDMAGNVKEWCWNEVPGGRMILGGGWNEPPYMFSHSDAQPPIQRLPTYGFRLVKEITPSDPALAAPITRRIRDHTKLAPAGDAQFEALRGFYRFDATPLNARVEAIEDARDWIKETISFDAAYGGERIRAYLFTPRHGAKPPYQAVVHVPGAYAQFQKSSQDAQLAPIDFLVRSGRAVLYPVYKGTFERSIKLTGRNALRDMLTAAGKDLVRSVDYLHTRNDIDATRLGFHGISLGGWAGVMFTVIEPRFKASVLVSSGLPATAMPPEIDPLNFAPRVRVPTLMVNGKSDFTFPVESNQRPLYRLLGVREDLKRHVVLDGGHTPIRTHDSVKAVLDWFDRHLGPITPP